MERLPFRHRLRLLTACCVLPLGSRHAFEGVDDDLVVSILYVYASSLFWNLNKTPSRLERTFPDEMADASLVYDAPKVANLPSMHLDLC